MKEVEAKEQPNIALDKAMRFITRYVQAYIVLQVFTLVMGINFS